MKYARLLLSLNLALYCAAGAIPAFADIVLDGRYVRTTDTTFGGDVLKIGYGGPCTATVAAGTTWNEASNVLIGCCPDDTVHAVMNVYGTANTEKNVYVSGKIRTGDCHVDGGTWNCAGLFYLGVASMGTLSIKNGGSLVVGDTFNINWGSTLTIEGDSNLTLTLNSAGSFGQNGGIYVFNNIADSVTLEKASNLVIDASAYTSSADKIVFERFFSANTQHSVLSNLKFSVGGESFTAAEQDKLNRYLSGIRIDGFEGYAKSFVVDAATQSVALHLSKIPEPSAFALMSGLAGLALLAGRRRKCRLIKA